MANLTPMMMQYLKIHEEVPDSVLLFRLGDFYEMFFDDAINVSKELGLTLTGRDCGLDERAPMCGVPHHAVDNYIAKLVEKGYKIAICDQISDPQSGKGIVEREIVRIITPGTVTDGKSIDENDNHYLMSVYYDKLTYGVVYTDVSTGETYMYYLSGNTADADLLNLLSTVTPAEIIVNTLLFKSSVIKQQIESISNIQLTPLPAKYFYLESCIQEITRQLNVYALNATGFDKNEVQIKACGALFTYLRETQKNALKHINKVLVMNRNEYMHLDYATKRNLELTETIRTQEKKGSLLWVLDNTVTSIGARTLKQWLNEPLLNKNKIERRHEVLSELTTDIMLIEDIQFYLNQLCDIQRLCSKISYLSINGKDLISLKNTLFLIPKIKVLLKNVSSDYLGEIRDRMDAVYEIAELLENSINEECGALIKDGNLIKEKYNDEIDRLKNLRDNAKNILAEIEQKEKEKTGIKNLKIKYNKVFGYYIEVTKSNIDLVPEYYIRKQTLVNSERYYTEELKEIESRLLSANDELIMLEQEVFFDIINRIEVQIERLQETAKQIGILDSLCSLAYVSYKNKYVRPYLNDEGKIHIIKGRHPVIEQMIGRDRFIPNDTYIDLEDERMLIITGPNMAGKSTYIRQVSIIVLMSQIGCFVPCEQADLSIADRIFTRVGASDDLGSGQSTFMVEMSEVSNILKYATKDSLVILDEVGRGTSTFDGLSIAWSVIEYLSNKQILGCKTLFATHYHELTELDMKQGIKNYSIKVKQTENGVLFLHEITPGNADKSYGIEVAKLAGLPRIVIDRAEEILSILEENEKESQSQRVDDVDSIKLRQTSTKDGSDRVKIAVAERIMELPINDMTPLEIVQYIAKIQDDLNKD